MEVVEKLRKATTLEGLRSMISIPKKEACGKSGDEYMPSSFQAFMALGHSQNVNNLENITLVSYRIRSVIVLVLLFSKGGIIIAEKGACFIVEKFLRSNNRISPFNPDN